MNQIPKRKDFQLTPNEQKFKSFVLTPKDRKFINQRLKEINRK